MDDGGDRRGAIGGVELELSLAEPVVDVSQQSQRSCDLRSLLAELPVELERPLKVGAGDGQLAAAAGDLGPLDPERGQAVGGIAQPFELRARQLTAAVGLIEVTDQPRGRHHPRP